MKNSCQWTVQAGGFAILLAALTLTACGEQASPVANKNAPRYVDQAAAGSGLAPHQQLARLIALGLRDTDLRNALDQAMDESPIDEGKLHLQTYLHGPGTPLLNAMV